MNESKLKAQAMESVGELPAGYLHLPTTPIKQEPQLTFEDALKIAKGCTDYGGGYRSNPEQFEIYQHGIQTVINCLKSAFEKGLKDNHQVAVLHSIGGLSSNPNEVQS